MSASALDRLWAALEEAGFPAFPMLPPTAGSAMRNLSIGEPPAVQRVFIPYHASVRGYDAAFSLLDAIIRALRADATSGAPGGGTDLVELHSAAPAEGRRDEKARGSF